MDEPKEMEGLLDLTFWVLGKGKEPIELGHYKTLYRVMRARGATDLEIRQGLRIRLLEGKLNAKT